MYAVASQSETRTLGFVGLSAFFHFSAFVLILVMKITQPDIKPMTVEIEILPPQGKQLATPLVSENKLPEPQLPRPIVKTERPHIKVAKMKTLGKLPQAFAKLSRTVRAARPVAPVRPLETPELESPRAIEAEDLSEDILKEDFEKVDRESATKIAAATAAMSRAQKQALLAQEDSLSEVKLEAQQEAKRQSSMAKARRAQELAAAQGVANERAAADARASIAREASALATARAAQAAAAQAEQAEENQNRSGSEEESAANKEGPTGSPAVAKYGLPGGVRALEDLKQRPGNRRPEYDYEDRLRGRQGEVIIVAYISKEGSPVQFKLVRSTGHRELDVKTLKALKAWRFFPGQEGWVEIPFKWDLKGGPQEMPATLRRKISRN